MGLLGTFVLVMIVGNLATIGLLAAIRRLLPTSRLKATNEVAVLYVTVIGTIYAVLLAFMLFEVWTEYNDAARNAELEANVIYEVARLAAPFPADVRNSLRSAVSEYLRAMIEDEWPAMERGSRSSEGDVVNNRIWSVVEEMDPHTPREQVFYDHILSKRIEASELRKARLLKSDSQLPGLLWGILICGAVLTVGFSSLLGVDDFGLHALQVVGLTSIILVTLFAISQISGPFHGHVHVRPDAFESARAALKNLK